MLGQWFDHITHGQIETELVDLRLASGRYGEFHGQGFLRWDRAKGVEIRALTKGGTALSQRLWQGPGLNEGHLIPSDRYLRLDAKSCAGHTISIDRLSYDGCTTYSNHDCVVWQLDNSHLQSPVMFLKGAPAAKATFTEILFSNAADLNWPRRSPSNQRCLQATSMFGDLVALELPDGDLSVAVESSSKNEAGRLVNAVSMAFSFWAGKLLRVVAYEARDENATECRLFPHRATFKTKGVAPPLGPMLRPALVTQHEELLKNAIDCFGNDDAEQIGTLLQASLCYPNDLPFSVQVLISCSALEGLAKGHATTKAVEAISEKQKADVEAFLKERCFPNDLIERFRGFMGTLNASSASNSITRWCKSGFMGFTSEDWDAWKLRNKPAHGNLSLFGGDFQEKQENVAKRDRIRNMINKLVMAAIGYRGKYYDYALHRELDFSPPQHE